VTANRILSQYMHGAGGYMSQINEKTVHIDELATRDMAALFNQEDKLVAWAVEKSLDAIAKAIDRDRKSVV
jgi:N-acetylmuramic acid 6-phosphate (MurNAc-6-P) etherase